MTKEQLERKIIRAKQIKARCLAVDITPPAWVRHLLDPKKPKAT